MSKEQKKIWNHRAYEKRKLRLNPETEPEKLRPRTNQEHTNALLEAHETRELSEHRGFNEVFTPRPRGNDPFNPRPMIKGSSDDPLAYGEKGTYICPIHGCPLTKRGCPVCNGEEC
jgi:hypothetical protein